MLNLAFPAIKQSTTISHPPDGLLQVNWNHPITDGLILLMPLWGSWAHSPINLVTGEESYAGSSRLPTVGASSSGIIGWVGANGDTQENRYFNLLNGTREISFYAVWERIVDYSGDYDKLFRVQVGGDDGDVAEFEPVTGYSSDVMGQGNLHDYSGGGGLTGPSPATPVGVISSGVATVYHDGTDFVMTMGQTDPIYGFRTTNGSATNPAWDAGNFDMARIFMNGNYHTASFIGGLWNRILSDEEIQRLTDLNDLWGLVKPLPRHFAIDWIPSEKDTLISVPNIIGKTSVVSPPPEGQLEVNWNHPVSNGLTVLVPSWGKYAMGDNLVNLVTGFEGASAGTKAEVKSSQIGVSGLNPAIDTDRINWQGNYPVAQQTEATALLAFINNNSGVGDAYGGNDAWPTAYSSRGWRFRCMYGGGNVGLVIYDSGGAIYGANNSAPAIGELGIAIVSMTYATTVWNTELVIWDKINGHRTSTASPSTVSDWGAAPDWYAYITDSSGGSDATYFFMATWNRALSLEEKIAVLNPNDLWGLFKPIPKYFYRGRFTPPLYGKTMRGVLEGFGRGAR